MTCPRSHHKLKIELSFSFSAHVELGFRDVSFTIFSCMRSLKITDVTSQHCVQLFGVPRKHK